MASLGLAVFALFAEPWFSSLALWIRPFGAEISLTLLGAGGFLIYLLILAVGLGACGLLPKRFLGRFNRKSLI
jgi:hypothetical protein